MLYIMNLRQNMIIDKLLKQEIIRNERMQDDYRLEIAKLPNGSLSVIVRNEKSYCYLRYRKDGKVVSEYVGNGDQEEILIEQIDKRKHLYQMLKALKLEHSRLKRMAKLK